MCLEEPNCDAFLIWGFTDKKTWLNPGENPLLWDTTYTKKPAYTKVYNALKNFDRNHASVKTRMAHQKKVVADPSIELKASSVSAGLFMVAISTFLSFA